MKYFLIILVLSFNLLAVYEHKGDFLLYETFDQDTSLFFTGEYLEGKAFIEDGKYIIDNLENSENFDTYSYFEFSKEKVFASTFQINFLEGNSKKYYGIYIETSEGIDYFYINQNKKIYSKFESNSGSINNYRNDLSDYIKKDEVKITILIDKSNIVYFVDEYEVCKTKLSEEVSFTGFGFSVGSNVKVAIDNVRFEEIFY